MSLRIVMADWAGYPLIRQKRLGENTFQCGLLPLLECIQRFPPEEPFDVILIVSDCKETSKSLQRYTELKSRFGFISQILTRGNDGADIGSYNLGYRKLMDDVHKGEVFFVNTSARGPNRASWHAEYSDMLNKSDQQVGLVGANMVTYKPALMPFFLTHFFPLMPHVQSYFLLSDMRILKQAFGTQLPGSTVTQNKRSLIKSGECAISGAILSCGYAITAKSDLGYYFSKGERWQGKLRPGFRFRRQYFEYVNQI